MNLFEKAKLIIRCSNTNLKACLNATDTPNKLFLKDITELEHIINNNKIRIVYQPIVCLNSSEVFGVEALCRGPEKSNLASPSILFPLAESAGLLYPLEKLCREQAILNLDSNHQQQKLFLNINPQIINDPKFTGGITKELLKKTDLTPQNIVFEITERTSIKDFVSFKKTLEHYRKQGFLVAIDDAGAGYSSLQAVAELKPDFIKIDMSLVHEIDKDPVKQALLETFLLFAKKIDSKIIAEGIESYEELQKLIDIGVDYGQGYFLARPAFPVPHLSSEAQRLINEKMVLVY